MNNIIKLLPLLFFMMGTCGLAQPLQDWITAAENAYENEDYYSAYRYYDVAIKYDTTRADIWYGLGESAQQFTSYRIARGAFERVANCEGRDTFPLLLLRQAQVEQALGNYANAIILYDQFLENPEEIDADDLEAAERSLINSEWAVDVASRPANTTVEHLGEGINSEFSDFGLYKQGEKKYFSSLRFLYENDEHRPQRELIKILSQTDENTPVVLPKNINKEGKLVAHTAFNEAGNRVFYTICEYGEEEVTDVRCELYSSEVDSNGKWAEPARLDINDPSSTNTQPNVGQNPATGTEYLYFASDRQGGRGKLDIYRSEIKSDGTIVGVEAMNQWNTDGNDGTPFYYAPSRVMYFSTDGRLTLGGYDVYRASWDGDDWNRPTNMGVPVNSSYNDLYYARFEEEDIAYFSSNRPDEDAIFWDESKDACCNDIYSVGITDEVKLLALTFNEQNLLALEGATVFLYEVGPNGRRLLDSITNPLANDFNFVLEPGKKYDLLAIRSGFSDATETVDLTDPALIGQTEIERKLYLNPGVQLDVLTFNGLDSTALNNTTVLLYEVRGEEQVLVDSIVNPTGNDHTFYLLHGKQYNVYARKDGYTPASTFIDMNSPECVNAEKLERKLYLDPGLILEAYTFRSLDNTELTGSTVTLYEYTEHGPIELAKKANPHGNQFDFVLEKGKRYVVKAERDGYGPVEDFLDLTSPDTPESGTIRKDLYLGQLLEIFTFDAETELELPGVEIKLLDPDTGEILAEKINAEGNDFSFTINLNKPFKLIATRKGYEDLTETLTFTEEDLTSMGGKLTFDLYLQPLEDPAAFLPLMLYYDNDYPDPKSYSRTTDAEYDFTNKEYYSKKQEFIQNFTEGMELEEAFLTRRRFNEFFDREVKGGRFDLQLFSEKLLSYLEGGATFAMEIRGFTSPRASKAYNERLSSRRIAAVRNYFERYEDGVLMKYIDDGTLTFETLPLGETKADPRVIADITDMRNSVYGIFASLERRVEISSK